MATSTAVKRKYNEKTYTRWYADLRKEVYSEIEEIREETGLSRAEFLKMLVSEKYNIKF
jgi:DNA-binding transcriptional regulator YiaG